MGIFLGSSTVPEWLFGSFLVLIGFVLFKLVDFQTRSEKTSDFSLSYWWKDNRIELFIGFIVFYVLFRFFENWTGIITSRFDFAKDLFSDKFITVFLLGLFFQIVLQRLRSILGIRQPEYNNGIDRVEFNAKKSSPPVGSRPSDRD